MNLILQAAGEIIAQRGLDGAGINAIADRAGANKVLIYRYFGSWNGLIEALYELTLADVHEQVDGQLPDTAVPAARSEMYIIQYYRALQTNQALIRLLRWQMDNQSTDLARRLANLQQEAIQQLTRNDAIEAGVIRLLLSGITHNVLMEDNQEDNSKSVPIEQVIHHVYARREMVLLPA